MTGTAHAPLAEVRGLTVTFDDFVAVRDVSFTLTPGKCVALVGESGSGKSVTARSLLGLVGRGGAVTAERLRLAGRDLTELSERDWRSVRGSEVGLVLQDALVSLDPLMRVGPQIAEALAPTSAARRQLRGGDRAARATELLERAGVPDAAVRARQYPHELSGGLRQRALIASAVAGAPGVLIADEPTTALDVTVQAQILALLGELRAEGTGLLLVSHDLAVVSQLADEILVLHRGEVVEQGPAAEVLGAPRTDYTKMLLAAIPAERDRRRQAGQTLPGDQDRADAPADDAPVLGEPVPGAPVSDAPSHNAPGADAAPASNTSTHPVPVLQALNLRKRYARPGGGHTLALDDVSFALNRGTTLGIVGESGSGKSTAANAVLGFTSLDAGEVLLDGDVWSAARERGRRSRRHRIQAISQDPLGSFDPRADVRGILTEALHAVGVPRPEHTERAVRLLEQVGLGSEHLARTPLELSGGQRQRVAIARALATDPEVIVCDEAVSALDVSVQAQVLDLLTELQSRLGVSLLFISHDLGVIRSIADEVIVMRGGRIVEAGRTEQVFTAPKHSYTRELLAAIPRLRVADEPAPEPTPILTDTTERTPTS
ncbi:dipeptide ABC transporter ATP-binding protein [Leucobacter aridicollis]|uniref:dipeptide ABC transporter ATP-binding protein n=1 Tax=Leucobacter aridicollis TaxID=283878 RepID=UPI0021066606|nr:ABC transporter ATP-binding protein [Leucobacter aridicollis]UTX53790.1 ABC transporter ATP-binding protein [Leucobacter aridicollis]